MPLVSAKCTNCGASLEIESTNDAAVCPYCDVPFIVEKAVNYYNTTNNITAEVVNVYGGNSADFVIRAGELITYNGASTSVVIPNSVTMIGKFAFKECHGLVSVSIPNSVTSIGDGAFWRCSSLREMILPDSIMFIGPLAFVDCDSLKEITIPDSVSLGEAVFSRNNNNLKINASEEWKKANWHCHPSLEAYNPQPQPQSQPQPQLQSQGGCYIATAVYGSYDCPSVWTLRRYRDDRLAKTFFGKIFIRLYYAVSPTVVCIFGRQKWFNRFWKKRLDKFVSALQDAGYDDSPYNDCK